MHLVHGIAGRIEELQAAADVVAVALLDRKAMRPDLREDAQVDVLAEHHGGVLAGDDLVVDADLLVHRAFVAGQRHDLADGLQAGQQVVDARFDADDAVAAMGRNQFGLGNAELGREIALAHLRIFCACPPDFVRGGFYALVHVHTPTC